MVNFKKHLSSEIEQRLLSAIDPGTKTLLNKYTTDGSLSLEIGCGPGQYRLAVNGAYIGIDLSALDYSELLPRTPDVIANAMVLPFKSNKFDLVFYSNTFYHFPEPYIALSEVRRILKPNGKLLIFDYSLKTLLMLKDLYVRSCPEWQVYPRNCRQWFTLLAEANFTEITLQGKSRAAQWLYPLVQCRLTNLIYYFFVDRSENSIWLKGIKTA